MFRSGFLVGVLVVVEACFGAEVNERAISMVRSGQIQEAQASWWGFDPEDATEYLQAAIDSGVKRLIIDNTGHPWVVRPISLSSNDQTIFFQSGVEVVAKRGAFQSRSDCLFVAREKENVTLIGYGATLRMHRDDYDDSEQYQKGEWRHVLSILSCSNFNVYGLTLAESGGDGIYLGKSGDGLTNKNIHIKDVHCDKNYRQGISVITAENLLIEDTVMSNTVGTPPESGIDFEPNSPDERLVNVIVRNCLTENNAGDGYQVALFHLYESSEPVSIRFENCRSFEDIRSVRVLTSNESGKTVLGSVEFVDCSFESSKHAGLLYWNKPANGFSVKFINCNFLDSASERPDMTPILFLSGLDATEPIGGLEFVDCLFRDSLDRNLLSYRDGVGGLPVEGVTGNIIWEQGDTREELHLTPEIVAEWSAQEVVDDEE